MSMTDILAQSLSTYFQLKMTLGFILAFIQFVLLQAVTLMEPTEVTGYIGQSITLKTGESPSSQLTQVEWSIFKNTTIIAKLKDGSQSLNRFWRYKGRLQLDHTTGDLFIKKLIQGDNLTYSVELKNGDKRKTHKIILKLREPRSKPEINITYSMLKANQCVIMLRCSSTEEDVQFYWNAMDNFVEPYWSGTSNQNSNESALWTSFSPNRNVTFTCAIRNEDSVSSDLTVKCLDDEVKPEKVQSTNCTSQIFTTLFVTLFIALLVVICCLKECRQRLIPENLRQL